MSNLREFTWSARVIQFLPLAGAIAVARRSVPVAGLLLTWLLAYVVVKGSASVATIESGSYWRLVMPALPAFALLAAAVPLLVPTFLGRMGDRLAPLPAASAGIRGDRRGDRRVQRRPDRGRCSSPPRLRADDDEPPIRVVAKDDRPGQHQRPLGRGVVDLEVRRTENGNELTWTDSTKRASTFYRVYRASTRAASRDMVCELRGVDRCELRSETLVTTRDQRFLDPDPPPDAVYRIGVAANWLDETDRGDVFALSPPVAPSALRAGSPPRGRRAGHAGARPPARGARCRPSAREDGRVVEKDGDHEHDRRREQDRRRIARDAEPPGDRVQPAAPGERTSRTTPVASQSSA